MSFGFVSVASSSPLVIRSAQDLKYRPVWGPEVIPTRLTCPLHGADELYPGRSMVVRAESTSSTWKATTGPVVKNA
jgi:hypothetical protein